MIRIEIVRDAEEAQKLKARHDIVLDTYLARQKQGEIPTATLNEWLNEIAQIEAQFGRIAIAAYRQQK